MKNQTDYSQTEDARDDIYKLAQTNPIVHACIMLHRHNGISFESAMIEAVIALEKCNKDLFDRLKRIQSNEARKNKMHLWTR